MKFDSLMQNDISNTVLWSKLKWQVEFQGGGRLFLQTGNSYISNALSYNLYSVKCSKVP